MSIPSSLSNPFSSSMPFVLVALLFCPCLWAAAATAQGPAQHPAVLNATADTAVLQGSGWGNLIRTPLGSSRQLPVSCLRGREAEALIRVPLAPLRRAPYLAIQRARLEVFIADQGTTGAVKTLEVFPSSSSRAWDEQTLTSEQWLGADKSSSPSAASATSTEAISLSVGAAIGSAAIGASGRDRTWQSVSLDPQALQAIAAGASPDAGFLIRVTAEEGQAALSLAAREDEAGAYAARLLLWYAGDCLPELDPNFAPWNSPEAHALFGELTAIGDAPVASLQTTSGGLQMRLDWLDDPRSPLKGGLIEAPAPPLPKDFVVSFVLKRESVRGLVNLSLVFSSPEGQRLVWRKPLDEQGASQTRCQLALKDFRQIGTPVSPGSDWDYPRTVALWAFDSMTEGAAACVTVSDFQVVARDQGQATAKRGFDPGAPYVATRQFVSVESGQAAAASTATAHIAPSPRVVVTFPGDSLFTAKGRALALKMARDVPLFQPALCDAWNPQAARLIEELGAAGQGARGLSFQSTVSALTAGEITRLGGWSSLCEGGSLATQKTPFSQRDRASLASLVLDGTARAVAELASGAVEAGVSDYTLNDPAWPRRTTSGPQRADGQAAPQTSMAGFGEQEVARLRDFLKDSAPAFEAQTPAGLARFGFWDCFEAMTGFRAQPEWFGYRDWDGFRPFFARAESDEAFLLRRERFLSQMAARYAWLRFVEEAARRAKNAAPRMSFALCASLGEPSSKADLVAALRCPSVDGVVIRRLRSAQDPTFEDVYHAWPLIRETAQRSKKRLGMAFSPDPLDYNGKDGGKGGGQVWDRLEPYAAAYAWRAAAGLDELRLDGFALPFSTDFTTSAAPRIEDAAPRLTSLSRGFAQATSDNARLLFERDILLIGDDESLDGANAFDPMRPFPNLVPLLDYLHVEFDFAIAAQLPSRLDKYRVVFLNASFVPAGLCGRLAQWLRADSKRWLVTLGALPARVMNGELFWRRADNETNPTTVVETDEAAALGLRGIRLLERVQPIFIMGESARRFPSGVKPKSLLTPASRRVYDYAVERGGGRDVLLALDDGFPLISETRPAPDSGRVVYLHYNAGLPAPSQIRFDRQVMASLAEYLSLQRCAQGGEGLSVQAFTVDLPTSSGEPLRPPVRAWLYIARPRPDPWAPKPGEEANARIEAWLSLPAPPSTAAAANPSSPSSPSSPSRPSPTPEEGATVYQFGSGEGKTLAVKDGRVNLAFVGKAPELIYIVPAPGGQSGETSGPGELLAQALSARRAALGLAPRDAQSSSKGARP